MAKRPPSFRSGQRPGAPVRVRKWASPDRRSASERGYGHAWQKLRALALERDKGLCQQCLRDGRTVVAREVDHIVPKHKGGLDELGNLQSLCSPCHKAKTAGEGGRARSGGKVIFSSHPAWFRRSFVPLTVVCGAPGSGKSTYVREHARARDRVICFDQIATKLFGKRGHQRVHANLSMQQKGEVIRVRNEMLADLMHAEAASKWPKAWLIVTEPAAHHRQWWADVLGAEVVVILPTQAECIRRVKVDAAGGDARSASIDNVIRAWFTQYQTRPGDVVIR